MKRMLINATQREELRVALVDGQTLYDLDIERPSQAQKKSNIYKGTITRVEPSLEACFVDYGTERNGFLPFKEISRSYLAKESGPEGGRISVKDSIKEGQELLVQIEKDERGTKGAAMTTFISLAGRYLVLMPNNPRAGGVSRRIEGSERAEIREALSKLDIPEGMGVIVRTAGVGRSGDELQWDLEYLLHLWKAIQEAGAEKQAPYLIYQDSNLVIRALRDYFRSDTGEILIDDPGIYEEALDFMRHVMPHHQSRLKLYKDELPLFNRFQIESQIESAFQRELRLPSGGALVFDYTEALISIDINSGRATKGSDIEETALNTNLEAASEIARQLRLRDLGGLIVIDFIDMESNRNQRAVEDRLRESLRIDRARVQIGRISRFGLLEMSRQRLRASLEEATHHTCPRCNGQGTIRSVDSLALSVLRIIEEEAIKEKTTRIVAQLPVEVATYLVNEKRRTLSLIEGRHSIDVAIIPNPTMHTPRFDVKRICDDESVADKSYQASEDFSEKAADTPAVAPKEVMEKPAVSAIKPPVPAPAPQAAKTITPAENGFIKRLWSTLVGPKEPETEGEDKKEPQKKRSTQRGQRNGSSRTRSSQQRPRGKRARDGKSSAGGSTSKPRQPRKKTQASQETSKTPKVQPEQPDQAAESAANQEPKKQGQVRARRRRGRRGPRTRTTSSETSSLASVSESTESKNDQPDGNKPVTDVVPGSDNQNNNAVRQISGSVSGYVGDENVPSEDAARADSAPGEVSAAKPDAAPAPPDSAGITPSAPAPSEHTAPSRSAPKPAAPPASIPANKPEENTASSNSEAPTTSSTQED